MKIPPPHGLVCAAGVFVLGRYCPYSGESCRCPEIRRAICQHRRKCHLPGMLLAPGCGKSVRRTAFLPDSTAPYKPWTYAREALPLPVSPLGSVSAPEEMPSPRHAPCPEGTEQSACLCAPKQKRRLRPGKTRQRAACCFYQAAEELSSSLLVWDSASSGFSGSAVSGSAVSSSSGI